MNLRIVESLMFVYEGRCQCQLYDTIAFVYTVDLDCILVADHRRPSHKVNRRYAGHIRWDCTGQILGKLQLHGSCHACGDAEHWKSIGTSSIALGLQ